MTDQLSNLIKEMQTRNLKVTPARKIILEILLKSGERLTNASELFDLIRLRNKQINISTVYRNLEALADCGLVQKLTYEGSAKYKLMGNETHRHHMICTVCNKTEPLPYCPLTELERTVQNDTDFLPTDHRIEIYGYCKECRHNKRR